MANQFLSPEGDLEKIFVSDYQMIDQYSQLGTLWLWGTNNVGQLGDNTVTDKSSPVQTVSGGTNWKSVNFGSNAAAIKTDGRLWLWGYNSNGQLGDNSITYKSSPVQTVSGGTDWKSVSANAYNTAAIKTDGTLWTWGGNSSGQLGDNSVTHRSSPVQTVSGGTNWKLVSCGIYHTAAIKTDGTLWLWGYNTDGQLGDNSITKRSSPVQTVAGGTNWKLVSCGSYHNAAIKTDGTLWTWGRNPYGGLGDNSTARKSSPVQTVAGGTNWKLVSCGGYSNTAAIKTDGTLWLWGYNAFGQLGTNSTERQSSPVQTVSGGTNWKSVSGSAYHTAAIKTDGTLWTWGQNTYGGLGDNSNTNRSSPVQTVAGGTNWKSVVCGGSVTAAIFGDGSEAAAAVASYSVAANTASLNEGSTVVFTTTTTLVPDATTLYWTLTAVSGTINTSDFSGAAVSGSFTITSNTGSVSLTLANDVATEGTESFQMQIRTTSTSGTIVATSGTVTVSDTSTGPTYSVTPSTSSLNEGSTVSFNVSTTSVPDATTLYWTLTAVSGTINTSDFSGAAVSGSFTITTNAGSVSLTLANDVTTEGTESFQMQIRTTSTSGTIVATSSTVTVSDTSLTATPAYITGTTKSPTLGSAGATWTPSGWTSLQNLSADDASVTASTPFTFTFNGTNYTAAYIGSNCYITFGAGSSLYSGLSASNPALNKIMLAAADTSYQRVASITSGTSYTRFRFEGSASTSGTVGSPTRVYEMTIFNPANYSSSQVIEFLIGAYGSISGITGVYSSSASLLSFSITASSSFVLVGNSAGTSWTKYDGFVNNSGY